MLMEETRLGVVNIQYNMGSLLSKADGVLGKL